MLRDDIVFYASLIICISLGSYYKKIEDVNMKRNYGVGLGLLVACLVCGHLIFHSILIVLGNIVIIRCCDKRYMHLISLSYTWLYLWYLHFNALVNEYMLWFHQILAMRLVGLAFEVTISNRLKGAKFEGPAKTPSQGSKGSKSSDLEKVGQALKASPVPTLLDAEMILTKEPNAIDIITYSYFFIGLHKGPYYRWKVLTDHFNAPFGVLGDCRIITEQKIKKAILCTLGYYILRSRYNPQIFYDPNFLTSYQSEARFLYCLPLLLMHYLRMNIVMMLCTGVCTETGFAVYPAKCNPVPGLGPSAESSLLKSASTVTDVALQQEYNFAMLRCFNNRGIFLGPKMKDTLKSWDMATRYWFWAYSYKSIVRAKKEVRSLVSFLLWVVWAGPSPQHLIMAATTWVYLNVEAHVCNLFATDNTAWNIGFAIMRALFLIYLAPCILIEDRLIVFHYYNSIYWVYHFFLLLLAVSCFGVHKHRRRRELAIAQNHD